VLELAIENVSPLHKWMTKNARRNRRLANLRDTLLLEHLNGEIELPDAEAIAEEAGDTTAGTPQ